MKQQSRSIARVALPLMAATLLSTPAFAQDTAQPVQVTPPAATPVTVTPPAPAPQAATPAPAAPVADSTGMGDRQSATPVNAEAAAAAEAESQERAAAARPQRTARRATAEPRAATGPAARTTTETPAATPAAPTAATPTAERSTPAAATPQPQAAPAAAPETAQTTQRTTTTSSGTPAWPFVVGGIVVLAGLAALLLRRRRREADDSYWDEPASDHVAEQPMTVDPTPVTATPTIAAAAAPAALDLAHEPVAAAVTPDDASVAEADAEDVAALTAGQTVSGRPWLELAMRPLRAGTRADEAMVEIELTVGNAGEVAAENVRISTFMLTADSDEMERMLIDPPVDAAVEPVTIDAGEGTRVDATLAVPRSSLHGQFQPIVVADARYRLPDGSEGRTSASFLVGVSDEGGTMLQPLDTDRTAMRDDVEARLYREPQRV